MSEHTDLSVTPIDIGFDLRLHDITVSVSAATRSVAYDLRGETKIVRGDVATIVKALTDAGYTCVVTENVK